MPYKDPEARRAYGRQWMRQNLDKARAAMRRWRAQHPEIRRARARAYYLAHQQEVIGRVTAYVRARPDVAQTSRRNRRSREMEAQGSFTTKEWQALVEAYGHCCAYCGASRTLVPDHRVALSRGGSNWIGNILPACRRCNGRKYTMSEEAFRELLRREGAAASATKPS